MRKILLPLILFCVGANAFVAHAQSPAPYRWVSPPPDQAGTNVAPKPVDQKIAIGAKGSVAATVKTPDGQATVILPAGAVAPIKGAKQLEVTVTPVDAATLTPPPAGAILQGNAYALVFKSLPSRTAVTTLATAGTLALRYPQPPAALRSGAAQILFSPDGKAWRNVAAEDNRPSLSATSSLIDSGYFVVSVTKPVAQKKSSKPFPWWVLLVIAGVAVFLWLVWRGVERRRRAIREREQRRADHLRRSRSTKKRRR